MAIVLHRPLFRWVTMRMDWTTEPNHVCARDGAIETGCLLSSCVWRGGELEVWGFVCRATRYALAFVRPFWTIKIVYIYYFIKQQMTGLVDVWVWDLGNGHCLSQATTSAHTRLSLVELIFEMLWKVLAFLAAKEKRPIGLIYCFSFSSCLWMHFMATWWLE